MGKMTRTRRTLIAADMARMLRELQQTSAQAPAASHASRFARVEGPALPVRSKAHFADEGLRQRSVGTN